MASSSDRGDRSTPSGPSRCACILSSSERTCLRLPASCFERSHRTQSQKWSSMPASVAGCTSQGGSSACASSKIRSTLTGPARISMKHHVSLSRSHCATTGRSGSVARGSSSWVVVNDVVRTLKSQSEKAFARPSALEPTRSTPVTPPTPATVSTTARCRSRSAPLGLIRRSSRVRPQADQTRRRRTGGPADRHSCSVTIVPDTKDWTWVLQRPCPECKFDAAAVDRTEVATTIRRHTATWAGVLTRPDVQRRPSPTVWSSLEYGCHVRDVFTLYDVRLALMLDEDDPLYANWDQDAAAVADRYGEQEPSRVAAELATAGAAIAARFDMVTDEQWSRTGRRSDGASFTVDSFARYFLHDVVHHLHDVGA